MFTKLFLLISFTICVQASSLQVVSDETILEALREHKNVLILFAKKNCVDNCRYEQSLAAIQDDFESTFSNGKILKVENSQLVRLYNPVKKEPALVFLRNGVPIIYDDVDSPDEIFEFFSENRDPIVKELDDTNFEHLTQASTGSTTGDWLVQFYDNSCVECQRLSAIWETVAAKLKVRMNVARVNTATKGIQTAKRFRVEKTPEFIFIRQGKFYRYNMKKYDIESFVSFATIWYKNLAAEKISVPASPFEKVVDSIVEKLKDLPRFRDLALSTFNAYPLAFLIIASVLVIIVLLKLFKGPGAKKDSKSTQQESKDTKKVKKTTKKEK